MKPSTPNQQPNQQPQVPKQADNQSPKQANNQSPKQADNQSPKQAHYIDGVGWRYEIEPSMLRRQQSHDYQSRCIYMLTLTLADRSRPLLGRLQWQQASAAEQPSPQPSAAEQPSTQPSAAGSLRDGSAVSPCPPSSSCPPSSPCPPASPRTAAFVSTPLGQLVEHEWYALCTQYTQLSIIRLQLMPEHLHVVLFVRERIPRHLGKLVGIVKNKCNKHYWQQLTAQGLLAAKGQQAPPPLFSEGFQDSILTHSGQLDNMVQYVEQNPYRALMKRDNVDLFRVVTNLQVAGITFAAIGNRWLLDRPIRMQVRCHNNTTPQNLQLIANQQEYFLQRGTRGGVVVSPCISAGEKQIARAALDARQPLIVILENGFPPMYKPPGQYFDACSEGLLLMLAPWPYHPRKATITRSQCLALNDMAATLSTEPWTPALEAELSH